MASVRIKSHFWIDWSEIAIAHEQEARYARHDLYPADPSAGLTAEKQASMIAVSASAHSVDALYGELKDRIPLHPHALEAWAEKRAKGEGPSRHSIIFENLKRGFVLGARTNTWPRELDWLFGLRDGVVHFQDEFHAPVPHPVGTNTSRWNVTYSLESASRAVDLLLEVLETCVTSPRTDLREVMRWASDMADAVQRLVAARSDS